MTHRPRPNPTALREADLDTPEMLQTALAIERDEQHLRMLARLAEIGMDLARVLAKQAGARIEAAAAAGGCGLGPGEDSIDAFARIAQSVRHTVALQARLADQVKTRRAGLLAERSHRRASLGRTPVSGPAGERPAKLH